jgi:hypothetical protein
MLCVSLLFGKLGGGSSQTGFVAGDQNFMAMGLQS